MKKYEIEINNEVYRVSVKELPADADMSSSVNNSEENVQTDAVPAPNTTSPASSTSSEGVKVSAPMAGTILSVAVSPGQQVSEGDTLIILEAMKMENEIVAPQAGVVGEIFVTANERVESDHVLLTI